MSNRHEINSDLINGTTVEDVIGNLHLQLNAAKTDITALREHIRFLEADNDELRELAQANNLLLIREGQAHRRCLDELKRVAEFAQCIGSPIEYEDDTIYLKGIKEYATYLGKEVKADAMRIHLFDEEIDGLRAKLARYEGELAEARANDRCSFSYLSEIREAMNHDGDFPTLVEKCKRYSGGIEVGNECI